MTLTIRPMEEGDAAKVAAMVKNLARDTGSDTVPKLTAESLIANRDLIDVTLAEDESGLLGACLTLLTYSTWRATVTAPREGGACETCGSEE